MPLDARLENERLRKLYLEDENQDRYNLLLLGEKGVGKTYLARTARLPVYIDSFDPGGTLCLREAKKKGDILAETKYEKEDPLKPTMFEQWTRDFEEKVRAKYFDNFGTYVLDSSTVWAENIMNLILAKDGRAGTAPLFTKDYVPQKVLIHNWLKKVLALPCDVIVTGHLEPMKDDVLGSIEYRYSTTGKGTVIIPLQFTEVWVADTTQSSKGIEYRIITQRTGRYMASSRLSAGKLDTYEPPDIKAILKKCGMDIKDKPSLFGSK
jgi:hypothetical protein